MALRQQWRHSHLSCGRKCWWTPPPHTHTHTRAYIHTCICSRYVWSLAPREAFADPFILVEAIECGALPIFVADWKDRSESAIDRIQNGFEYDKILQGRGHMHEVVRELPPSELLEGLPFADVLDWSTFADAIDYSNIGMLGARLVTKSPSTMQLYLKAAQPLFKEDGILGYIMHRLGAQENLI